MPTNTPSKTPAFAPTASITTRTAVSTGVKPQAYFPKIDPTIPHAVQRHLQLIYNRLYNHALAFGQIINGQTPVVTTSTATQAGTGASLQNFVLPQSDTAAGVMSATPELTRVRTSMLGPGFAALTRKKPRVPQPSVRTPALTGLSGSLLPGVVLPSQAMIAAPVGIMVRAYTAVTAAYTIDDATDFQIDCTSGSFAVTLPLASSVAAGQVFSVKDSGTGTITLAASQSDLIDGQPTQTLNQSNDLTVMSTGSGWIIIGRA